MAPGTVALTDGEERVVDDPVGSGRFRDAAEAVREERAGGSLVGCTLEELKAEVRIGLDDLENGRIAEFESGDPFADPIAGRTDALRAGLRGPRRRGAGGSS